MDRGVHAAEGALMGKKRDRREAEKKKFGSRRKPFKLPAREGATEKAFLDRQKRDRPEAKWIKLNTRGHAARPDREGVLAMGRNCFIEFKRVGEFPTKAQCEELDELEALNHFVAACDTVEQACRFVSDVECGVTRPWRRRWEDDHDK